MKRNDWNKNNKMEKEKNKYCLIEFDNANQIKCLCRVGEGEGESR